MRESVIEKMRAFGFVEQLRRLVASRVALLLDFARRVDELPEHHLVVHDAHVVLDVRDRGRVLHDLREFPRRRPPPVVAALELLETVMRSAASLWL